MPSYLGFDFVDSSHLSLFFHTAPLTSRSEYSSVSDRTGELGSVVHSAEI